MSHAWDLYEHYHSCPKCGYILISRTRPTYHNLTLKKPLDCPRCQHHWTEQKPYNGPIAPLFNEPSPPEFTWE
ncbi:MAG: hypothetical protein KDK62_07640 [Chlamydiia bacterium]|nr:hypothetical protein [Chlamydiia bacterium]